MLTDTVRRFAGPLACFLVLVAGGPLPVLAQGQSTATTEGASPGGPVRLRQPQNPPADDPNAEPPRRQRDDPTQRDDRDGRDARSGQRGAQPGEFERYVQRVTNDTTLRRFGAELVIDEAAPGRSAPEAQPIVPPDYRIAPGDEVLLSIWGSVDADLRLVVDRGGRISVPRVGAITVVGVPLADLGAVIDRQMRRVFKNFELSASLGRLRGIRVFVTGFAVRPGAHTVNSLATLSSVVFQKAGGPSASGSFRDIELRRGGRVVARLDLYDLMLFGRRDADALLQADDVVHIGPVQSQVALVGSVNKPAVFEVKPNETVGDLLRMAGGLNAVADRTRLAIERLGERTGQRITQLALPADQSSGLAPGDLVRAFSAVDAQLPLERQNKRVRVEGEVARPGDYILPPNSSVADALRAAGGMTANAFVFGTEFTRETTRVTQQMNYERALRDLELEISKRSAASASRTAEEASSQTAQQLASDRLLARLREARPNGRIVLQLQPESRELPDLALEDGDRIAIPARPTSVGVFGSVFNAGSYLFLQQRTVGDYLRLAGSVTRNADAGSVFVVRANGSVVSARQKAGDTWFASGSSELSKEPVLPGDTVFVPDELNKTTFVQAAKDWSQILYQLGLSLLAIRSVN